MISEKDMIQETFIVHGMKCQHCQAAVESALLEVVGVKEARVSLIDSSVTVDYDEGIVTTDMLRTAVEGAGRFVFEA